MYQFCSYERPQTLTSPLPNLTCHQIRWRIPALLHKLFSGCCVLLWCFYIHTHLSPPTLNNIGSFNIKWRKLKGSVFCPRSHWKFPMVKHLSSFPPSGNDSYMSGFQVTLLNEIKLFLGCSPCHHFLPSDVSVLSCRAEYSKQSLPSLSKGRLVCCSIWKISWRIFFQSKAWSYWAKRRMKGKKHHHIICIPHWLTSQMISYSFTSSLHCTKRGDPAGG